MASTYSPLKIELMATGDQSGTWGATTNSNLEFALSEAITGSAGVDFATAADVTITLTNTNTTQTARNLRLNITESSTGVGYAGNLILGSGCQINKFYLINNATTAAKSITNTSCSGVAVSTITFVTTTATVTTSSNHGLTSGQTIVMTLCTPAAYNGTFVVTVTGLTTFTYTMGSTPSGNASPVGSYTTAGLNVVVPANSAVLVFNNGANVVPALDAFGGTGAILLPVGTTAQRPTGASGKIRYNSTNTKFEGYSAGAWSSIGGGATGGGADQVFVENGVTVTTNYTLTTGYNAESVGPITINSGATVTVPSGQRWVIL